MSKDRSRKTDSARVKSVIGQVEGGWLRNAAAWVSLPVNVGFWRVRNHWLMHRDVNKAHRWHNPVWTTVRTTSFVLLTALFAAWFGFAVLVAFGVFKNVPWPTRQFDENCGSRSFTCAPVSGGIVITVLLAAGSTILFLSTRQFLVRRQCVQLARRKPKELVETAGALMGQVVGRDLLCDAIMNNLHDRRVRRPHVIVGGIGVGKTATLVHLTERLAAKGAVPIPIRLSDAQKEEDLDFNEMARKRFGELVKAAVSSDAEEDRVWRWLRQRADRIVVLADGLEEALVNQDVAGQRDNTLRKAIRDADRHKLPLVIASRPHEPLRAMQAAITELEPLSVEAALRFVKGGGNWRSDPVTLDYIVETAGVVDAPLYMQIAKDLYRLQMLEPVASHIEVVDPEQQDRWALRQDLMGAWLNALLDGRVSPELPIDLETRAAVVEFLSALACIGMAAPSQKIRLSDLDPSLASSANGQSDTRMAEWRRLVAEELDRRMQELRNPASLESDDCDIHDERYLWMDVRLAVTWGARMGLVREFGDTVQFQHSVMKAFLGSRFVPCLLADSQGESLGETVAFLTATARQGGSRLATVARLGVVHSNRRVPPHIAQALRDGAGELIEAFILYSRAVQPDRESKLHSIAVMCDALRTNARQLLDDAEIALKLRDKQVSISDGATPASAFGGEHDSYRRRALESYGAAIDVTSLDAPEALTGIFEEISGKWKLFGLGEDSNRLYEAKLAVVRQWRAAALHTTRDKGLHMVCKQAYHALYEIGCQEPDDRVRLAIAEAIGEGKESAFEAIASEVHHPVCTLLADDRQTERDGQGTDSPPPSARRLRQVAGWVPNEREQRILQADEAGRSERKERRKAVVESESERQRWYRCTMRAWLLPMLVESSHTTYYLNSPQGELDRLVDCVVTEGHTCTVEGPDGQQHQGRMSLGERRAIGLALAQGFKYAANCRTTAYTNREARKFLIKRAEELLQQSDFWYTRITLLHALTLWALPDDPTAPRPLRGPGSDPRDQISQWLGRESSEEHELVKAAAKLARRALQTRHPERFLWIDEGGVASQVGTGVSNPAQRRFHNRWIPPSVGWSTLDPAAQQLLADALILLVLSERNYRPKDLFHRLEQVAAKPILPSCLSKDRNRLNALRAVEDTLQPGDSCKDDCRLKMCPYPAKAEGSRLHTELSEVFCLNQHYLLTYQPRSWAHIRFRRRPRWARKVPVAGMRRFWDEMGLRARDQRGDDTDDVPARLR